jgi:hypothetical protein
MLQVLACLNDFPFPLSERHVKPPFLFCSPVFSCISLHRLKLLVSHPGHWICPIELFPKQACIYDGMLTNKAQIKIKKHIFKLKRWTFSSDFFVLHLVPLKLYQGVSCQSIGHI